LILFSDYDLDRRERHIELRLAAHAAAVRRRHCRRFERRAENDRIDPRHLPAFRALLDEARETTAKVDAAVAAIIADVRAKGDAALLVTTARFDRWTPRDAAALRVTAAEMDAAVAAIPAAQRDALEEVRKEAEHGAVKYNAAYAEQLARKAAKEVADNA
jgi:histidinol dehydrogenase